MIRANCGVQGQNRTVGIGRHVFKMERSQLYLLKKKKNKTTKNSLINHRSSVAVVSEIVRRLQKDLCAELGRQLLLVSFGDFL